MNFKNEIIEQYFINFKWTRNNTLQLLKSISTENFENDNELVYQFQCIITTSDTYYRKLTNNQNQKFGVVLDKDEEIAKRDIQIYDFKNYLQLQLNCLELILKNIDNENLKEKIKILINLNNHEYLHQGQLIQLFATQQIEFPVRFKKAWAL